MQFYLLFLFLAAFIFLFTLYWIGKDDLILLKKNIALEQLFNLAFITLGVAFFSSRLFYVLFHPSYQYLNPLVFLVFPYFPGLSLFGGISAVVSLLFYLKLTKKIPAARILDFFTLSFLVSLPFGYIGQLFISPKKEHAILFILALFYIFIASVFFLYLYPKLLVNRMREGKIALLFSVLFPVVSLLSSAFSNVQGYIFFIGGEEIGRIILCIGGILILIYQYISRNKHKNTTGQ